MMHTIPASEPAPAARPLAGHRVMLLHGDGAAHRARADLFAAAFAEEGARVRTIAASDAPVAARAILEHCPSLVFTFGVPPQVLRVCERARIPAAHVVSELDPEVAELCAALGAGSFGHRQVVLLLDPEGAEPRRSWSIPAVAIGAVADDPARVLAAVVELALQVRASYRRHEQASPPPEGPLGMPREQFVEHLYLSSAPSLDRSAIEAIVDGGDGLDLPSWPGPRGRVYHRLHAFNWALFHSARFYEAEARSRRAVRAAADLVSERRAGRCCAAHAEGPPRRVVTAPRRVRMRASYAIDVEGLAPDARLKIFLPTPIETDAQREVRIVSCTPSSMRAALVARVGYVYGAELLAREAREVAYQAELTVHEVHAHGFTEARPRATLPLPDLVERLRREGPPERARDVFERAWLVYDAMMQAGRFAKMAPPCPCPPCSAKALASDGGGHCITWAHAFIAHCDAVGIGARPVRGALFTFARGANRFGYANLAEPIFGHTWVELDAKEAGYIPVELHASVFKATSAHNCLDDALKRALEADEEFLRRFYFGSVDHQRVVCSSSVLTLPPVMVHDRSAKEGRRWTPLPVDRIRFDTEFEYA